MSESKTWLELHHEATEKRLLEKLKLEVEQRLRHYGYKPKVVSNILDFYVNDGV